MKNSDKFYIADIHSHIVPYVDDGAEDMDTALKMVEKEYNQGVRIIICSSHNGYSHSYINNYLHNFSQLQARIKEEYPHMTLLTANEIYCTGEDINEIINLLSTGEITSVNNSQYILTEFSPYVSPSAAETVINRLLAEGWIPIIAHFERYKYLYDEDFITSIIQKGVLIQTNLFSYVEEPSSYIKNTARKLLKNKFVHFVGSDSHGIARRTPVLDSGVDYILKNTTQEYARQILFSNAVRLFLKGDRYGNC